jgi:site-specific recombinase XerD
VDHFHLACRDDGLSTEASNTLLHSVGTDTLKSYNRYWQKFSSWLAESRHPSDITIPIICDFLTDMYKQGYNSNTLNTMRSALNFFSSKHLSIGDNPYITQLFQAFYKTRPIQSKYLTFWPVGQLLTFLAEWHPASSLSLKQLTLKTLALLALSSSDRGQTLHSINIENTDIVDNTVVFVVNTKLKTTRRVIKNKVIKCIATDTPPINVCDYVLYYLNKTLAYRVAEVAKGNPKPTKLFLSWATKRPVTKQSIARWLKYVLTLAGIHNYSSHSYRGAGLSHAFAKGVTIDQIIKAGDWTTAQTFQRFYNKPSDSSTVGRIILSQGKRFLTKPLPADVYILLSC